MQDPNPAKRQKTVAAAEGAPLGVPKGQYPSLLEDPALAKELLDHVSKLRS